MADQPIELTDHDPVWSDRFAEQQARLIDLLKPWLAGKIEHIGSNIRTGIAIEAGCRSPSITPKANVTRVRKFLFFAPTISTQTTDALSIARREAHKLTPATNQHLQK